MTTLNSLYMLIVSTFVIINVFFKATDAGVITSDSDTGRDDYEYDVDDVGGEDADDGEETETPMKTIKLWPNGIIPYLMPDGMYDEEDRSKILSGMRRWEYKTCIKFVPWTDQLLREYGEKRYLNFFSAGSCFSRTGMEAYQPQLFGLGKGCLKTYTIIHELGHAIGMIHTMERTDRDFYIDINYDNINTASRRNFDTALSRHIAYNTFNTPYDYKSIMHYGTKAWSNNNQPTMVTKDPAYQNVIGKVKDISFYDALYVNRAYGCSERCPVAFRHICKHGGFLGGPDCRCICQDGYGGQFCELALPGFEHIVEWKCQNDWVFHEGKCYKLVTDDNVSYTEAKSTCERTNASLVIFKGRPEMEWLNHIVSETKELTGKSTFWVGMEKEEDSIDIKWLDDSIVNTNIVSVTDSVGTGSRGCAKFNGEAVTIDNCTEDENNGFICEKNFDSTCGGRYVIYGEPVNIQSPGFPNGYPNDMTCTYTIQASEQDSRIKIQFDSFNLDTRGEDYLDVLLNNDVTAEKERYKRSALNGLSLESEGNLAILEFKSNSRLALTGFRATITEIKPTTATTQSPYPLLDAVYKVFRVKNAENVYQQNAIILKQIYNIFKSMTFSNLFR